MRKKAPLMFLLIIPILLLSIGCSTTSLITNQFTESESSDNNIRNKESVRPIKILDFEEVVENKIWYTMLESEDNDVNHNNLYQIRLEFNTTEKTFLKEIYRLKRDGNTNNYIASGYSSQKCKYYYEKDNKNIYYEVIEDYEINANSSKKENIIIPEKIEADYSLKSEDVIIWENLTYYELESLN